MRFEEKHRNFIWGVGLFAEQAGNSLARALPSQLADLRVFYVNRPSPRNLAREALIYSIDAPMRSTSLAQ